VDIIKRRGQYSQGVNYKNQTKLYNSLVKYGFSEHIFEVIEECTIEELNTRERYWQDSYKVLSENGLNCRLTETNTKTGKLSQSTIKKISEANTGVKNGMYGRVHSEEAKIKIRAASLGRTHTAEAKKTMSELKKGVKKSVEHIKAIAEKKKKRILQYSKDERFIREWSSVKEAGEVLSISRGNISSSLTGTYKSAGGYIWRYKK
jgi:group I intron endonuclease